MNTALRVECPVHFRRHGRGAAQELQPGGEPAPQHPPRLPRVTRLLALAIRFEQLVRSGAVQDYATLAKLGQVSRARISQITNLLLLAPDIQEALLFLSPIGRGRAPVILADLQPIAALADWGSQRRRWRALCARWKLHVTATAQAAQRPA
jgi:hypothetical protein